MFITGWYNGMQRSEDKYKKEFHARKVSPDIFKQQKSYSQRKLQTSVSNYVNSCCAVRHDLFILFHLMWKWLCMLWLCVITYAGHLVPGDVHSQVSHLGSNSWQADQPLHTVRDVSSKLLLQHGWRQLQKFHLILEKGGWEKPGELSLRCRNGRVSRWMHGSDQTTDFNNVLWCNG